MTFTVPVVCQYCRRKYAEKGGFASPDLETTGICPECFPPAMEAMRRGENYVYEGGQP
jgi:hypothetical protein